MKARMNKTMTKLMNNKWTKPLIKQMKAKMNKLTTKMMKIQMRQVEIQTKVKQVLLMKVNRIHQMRVNRLNNVIKITSLIRDNVSHTLV
jgi:membrane protease subunit (stomatin/prohibitin family)